MWFIGLLNMSNLMTCVGPLQFVFWDTWLLMPISRMIALSWSMLTPTWKRVLSKLYFKANAAGVLTTGAVVLCLTFLIGFCLMTPTILAWCLNTQSLWTVVRVSWIKEKPFLFLGVMSSMEVGIILMRLPNFLALRNCRILSGLMVKPDDAC